MAQISFSAAPLLALLMAAPVYAAPSDDRLDQALTAEGENRWQDALRIYYRMLEAEPDQADIWLRVSDIHTTLKETPAALKARTEAAKRRPDDAQLHYSLALEYSANNQPQEALVAVKQALLVDPNNASYLRLQAQLAEWTDDSDLVRETYQTILRNDPGNRMAMLGMARMQSRTGDLDKAVRSYEKYLEKYPDDADALLIYAETEIYRGDYVHADELLQRYQSTKGETPAYQTARANFHARAGRPALGKREIRPLLTAEPDNYDFNLINTLALNQNRERRAALDSLPLLERLGKNRPETKGANLEVRTPLRSYLGGGIEYSSDTDDIRILRREIFGGISPTPETTVLAGFRQKQLKAPSGSGLEPLSGSNSIDLDEIWLAGSYQFTPQFAANLGIGRLDNGRNEDETSFNFSWLYWATEQLNIGYQFEHDVVDVSPRAVDIFIPRNNHRARFSWEYGYRTFVDGELLYSDYDDGNRLQQATISPRWAFMRTQKHNLDLGFSLQWFSFSKDLNNGYYDPDQYERLWGVAYYYRKLSENDGVSVVLGLGPERDQDLDGGYELGGNFRVEGIFGIYRDWQFRSYAEMGGRFSDSSAGSAIGRVNAYRGYNLGLELIRRF